MVSGSKAIKITAKTVFKKNPLKIIIAHIAFITCFLICYFSCSLFLYAKTRLIADILFFFLSLFIIFPLFMGTFRLTWRSLFDIYDNPISVFYYLSTKAQYLKIIKLLLRIIFKLIPIIFVVYLPYFIFSIFTNESVFEAFNMKMPFWLSNFPNVVVLFQVVAKIIILFYSIKFYIAPILIIADENMDIDEAIYLSTVISNKSNIDFIYLIFSLIGWILLSILIIPLIFTLPYIVTCYLVHVRFAIAEYNSHINNKKINVEHSFSAVE